MKTQIDLQDIAAKAQNRRSFMAKLGLASAAAATIHLTGQKALAADITDVDVLNFALNLEYLEAEFYTVATTGKTIEEIGIGIDGTGNPGPTSGGERVRFRGDGDHDRDDRTFGNVGAIAKEIAFDEQQHVLLLRSALGSAAIAKPAINLDALGFGFERIRDFLALARAFEDVGVSAYGGAAPLLTSKDILATAARIALTEALHAGNLRLLVAGNHVRTTALDDSDILPPPSGKQYFGVNDNGLSTVRTVSQVLAIVYASSAAGTSAGGFFPNGVNGTITMV